MRKPSQKMKMDIGCWRSIFGLRNPPNVCLVSRFRNRFGGDSKQSDVKLGRKNILRINREKYVLWHEALHEQHRRQLYQLRDNIGDSERALWKCLARTRRILAGVKQLTVRFHCCCPSLQSSSCSYIFNFPLRDSYPILDRNWKPNFHPQSDPKLTRFNVHTKIGGLE